MQRFIALISLAGVLVITNGAPQPINCDFSLNAVQTMWGRAKEFQMNGAVDPEDSSVKMSKFWRFMGDGIDNILQMQLGNEFIAETYIIKGNEIISNSGLIQMGNEVIDYERMKDGGFTFKEMQNAFSFNIPMKSLDMMLPDDIQLDDKYRMIFNRMVILRRKLYMIGERIKRDYPDLMLYDFKTGNGEYHLQ